VKYRLYIDEVGNSDIGASQDPNLAHPDFKTARARLTGEPPAPNFGGEIAQVLPYPKYGSNASGTFDEWGIKWLP
jgi:hypothetical protein